MLETFRLFKTVAFIQSLELFQLSNRYSKFENFKINFVGRNWEIKIILTALGEL